MKLSIIIPVYNDRDYIEQAMAQVRQVRFSMPVEIIAVDDCSVDGSREVLQSIPGITVILHEHNTGKGGAIKTGLAAATGDIMAIQDDDCEYDPTSLPYLMAPIVRGETDVVYGSRFLRKNQMFLIQRLENRAITWLANLLLGQRLTDIETGHKVFSKRVAQQLDLKAQGFEFDMEITLQITQLGYRIKELPTTYTARSKKQGKKITYKDGLRSIQILLKYAARPWLKSKRFRRLGWTVLLGLAIFIPRLISLGQQLTVDEPLWKGRGEQFIKGFATGHFEETLVGGQPGVTTAWLAGMSLPWRSLAASQAAIGIATGLLVTLCTYFLVQLWGWRGGIVGGFILGLNPFLLGHSRVVHTDALLALFSLGSMLALLSGCLRPPPPTSPTRRYLVASAILAALAITTKLFGIFLIPVAILTIAVTSWQRGVSWQRLLRAVGLWVTVAALTVYLVWPVLWLHSDTVITYLFERSRLHASGTRIEEITSLPWYYAREIPFRLSTLGTILVPAGLLSLLVWRRQWLVRQSICWLLLAAAVLLALASSGADKSDRYVLFALLVLELCGVVGLMHLSTLVPRHAAMMSAVLPTVVIGWLAVDAFRLHPYYLAHYNRFYPIERDHKLGWGEGLEQAAAWVTQQHPNATVVSYYPRVFNYFYQGEVEPTNHLGEVNYDFVVLYRSMFERGEGVHETQLLRHYLRPEAPPPAHVITINDLPYVWIFSRQPTD